MFVRPPFLLHMFRNEQVVFCFEGAPKGMAQSVQEKTVEYDSLTFVVIIKQIKFGLMKTNLNILFKNGRGELSNSLYISLLFFNFMPKQSTHVAGYTAAFSLCEIYRSNINDNSYLMPLVPPLHISVAQQMFTDHSLCTSAEV